MLLAALPGIPRAEVAIPALESRVTDQAGLLDPAERRALEEKLAAFERETTHQIAVLTIATTEGEPVESLGIRLAEAWKIGQAGRDNGAILLVVRDDRVARIEVGYGLEGVIPDARAKRILDESVLPQFRRGDHAAGIEAGVRELMRAARGERFDPAPREREGLPASFHTVLLAAVLGSFLGRPFGARRGARWLGPGAGGLAAGGIAYAIQGVFTVALFAALLGALLAGGLGFSLPFARARHGGFRGGLAGGGNGFGFGGGGFRGGGGGFGGGGASGRW